MFGQHLMLDCYGCKREKLENKKFILNFLKMLPRELDMHMIKEPFILNNQEGIFAIVFIAESHISIHTFPDNNGCMNLDIFSCKNFDVKKVISIITENFKPQNLKKNLVMRGSHFPKEKYLAIK